MTKAPLTALALSLAVCGALALAAIAAPLASAQKYTDVTKSCWAATAIESVTDRGPDGHKVLDDYGTEFKPEKAITRELLARSLVLASGNYGEHVKTVPITDVPESERYYDVIEVAVHHGYLQLDKDGNFDPQDPVPAYQAEVAVVRWLKEKYPSSNWSLLTSLRPSTW